MGRSDADLVAASKRGERDAFAALIERYQDVVSAVSFSRTGDHALSQDIAQDTFLAAWGQLDRLREPARLRPWLCGIARNLARKARRRTARETPLDQPLVFEGANPFDQAARAESERVVREALLRVPETYRDVLVLYYRDQCAVRDIAAALGLSEANVLQRLARGRQYLADGVTDLVERALRGAARPRNLALLVLPALPALAPSRADAATAITTATRTHGATMIKFAITAVIAAVSGTAGYTVHALVSEPAPPPAPVAAPAERVVRAETPHLRSAISVPPAPALPPDRSAGARAAAPQLVDSVIVDDKADLNRGPSRGPAVAPVTIIVFTDMLCDYCGRVVGTLDQLWDEYPGKLRMVIKQRPVHPAAALPAEASFAADAQGKFWELYDLMYAHQDDLSHDNLIALAERAGLDVPRFRAALDDHTYAAALQADIDVAKQNDVNATPVILINGTRIVGNQPIDEFRRAINEALAKK